MDISRVFSILGGYDDNFLYFTHFLHFRSLMGETELNESAKIQKMQPDLESISALTALQDGQ